MKNRRTPGSPPATVASSSSSPRQQRRAVACPDRRRVAGVPRSRPALTQSLMPEGLGRACLAVPQRSGRMATSVIMMELLGRGAHSNPRRGCNILELASVLAGERWDSCPQSVHPALAAAAGMVNDLMSDDRRRLLTPLAPWLPGTNTPDPRVWPAVADVCIRAGLASSSGLDQPGLLAGRDTARNWLAAASLPRDERHREFWAGCRDRCWARRAIRSALLTVAASASQCDADAVLCEALVDCINKCRQLAGEQAVDPRLPLVHCPQHMAVQSRVMWSSGCDWMEVGYQLVPSVQEPDSTTQAQHANAKTEAAG